MVEAILELIEAELPLLLALAFIMAEATMVVLASKPLVIIERLPKQLLVSLRGRLDLLTIIHPFSSCKIKY
jgi:hypothetical protein